MNIILYGHFSSLPTGKIVLALNVLGLPFTFRKVDLFADEQFDTQFRVMNPASQVPVLIDGDTTLTQSAVILLYLADKTGLYGGKNPLERRRITEWLFYEADMFSSLRIPRTLKFVYDQDAPEVMAFHKARAEKVLSQLDKQFTENDYLTGSSPTIADIAMFPVLDNCHEGLLDVTERRGIVGWLERMRQLPNCRNHYMLMNDCTIVALDELPSHQRK